MSIKGIDVSHWQDLPNTEEGSDLGFCFIKATQGANSVDPAFESHWGYLKPSHLLLGAYHYFDTAVDPIVQAQHFWDTISPFYDEFSLPPVIDLEDPHCQIHGQTLAIAVTAFCEQIKTLSGKNPIIYTNKAAFMVPMALAYIDLSSYPLWDACYGENPATPYSGWTSPTFWQFTDHEHDAGTTTDGDLFMGTPDELLALTTAGTSKDGLNGSDWVAKYGIKVI